MAHFLHEHEDPVTMSIYIVYHDYKQKPTPLPHFESKRGFSQAEISQNGRSQIFLILLFCLTRLSH